MKQSLILSERGQITLPAGMRKSLGLKGNAVVTAEQVGGKIVLTPAVVVETELYTEDQVAEWNRTDAFQEGERERLLSGLKKRRKRA